MLTTPGGGPNQGIEMKSTKMIGAVLGAGLVLSSATTVFAGNGHDAAWLTQAYENYMRADLCAAGGNSFKYQEVWALKAALNREAVETGLSLADRNDAWKKANRQVSIAIQITPPRDDHYKHEVCRQARRWLASQFPDVFSSETSTNPF
jgi:hypothetical protein